MKRLLIITDAQHDFIDGTLPVAGAAEAMDKLTAHLLDPSTKPYDHIILTADFHPWGHCSFGEWPVHCVAHTHGASIWQSVLEAAYTCCPDVRVLTKGTLIDVEEYSILKNTVSNAILQPLLEEADIIDVCGMAGDYCVLNSLIDMTALGYAPKLRVVMACTPSIDDGSTLRRFIEENNIRTIL